MSHASWPAGLTPQTPLPFRLWRVMTALQTEPTLADAARACSLTSEEMQAAQSETAAWVARATKRQEPLDAAQEAEVTAALTSVVGPMARLMIEDVLADLEDEGQVASLNALLSRLAPELSAEQRTTFAARLRARSLM